MITHSKTGSRRIELYIPVVVDSRKVSTVTIHPMTWGHTLDWQAGKYQSPFALLTDLTGGNEPVLRALVYPDADRVLLQFMDLLPQEIREDIARGHTPQPAGAVTDQPVEPQPAENVVEEPPPEPALAEDHPDYTKPGAFVKEEWDKIRDQALDQLGPAERKRATPLAPQPDTGLGFVLEE